MIDISSIMGARNWQAEGSCRDATPLRLPPPVWASRLRSSNNLDASHYAGIVVQEEVVVLPVRIKAWAILPKGRLYDSEAMEGAPVVMVRTKRRVA